MASFPGKAVLTSSAPKARNTEGGCSVSGMGRQTRTPAHGVTRREPLTPEPVWVFLNFIYWLVFGCAGSPLLLGLSLVAASGACSLVAGPGRLVAVVPLLPEHGLRAGAQQLGHTGLAAPRRAESSWTREQNPCLLHWLANSLSRSHHGSPPPFGFECLTRKRGDQKAQHQSDNY